jgi:hypothetical protein
MLCENKARLGMPPAQQAAAEGDCYLGGDIVCMHHPGLEPSKGNGEPQRDWQNPTRWSRQHGNVNSCLIK